MLCEYLLQSAVSNKKLIRKYSNKKVPYTSLATNFTQRKVQTIRIRNGQIYRLIKLFVVFRLNIIIFISYLYWITQRDGPNKKYIVMTLVILFLVVVMVVVIVEVVVLLLVL